MQRKMRNPRGVGHRYGKRHVPGEMNKTEEQYSRILQELKNSGVVAEWYFESVTFKLAKDLRYTPDFFVYLDDGTVEVIDVKGTGPIDDKSIVKIKAAAEKFFCFSFYIEKLRPKKDGGGFERRAF